MASKVFIAVIVAIMACLSYYLLTPHTKIVKNVIVIPRGTPQKLLQILSSPMESFKLDINMLKISQTKKQGDSIHFVLVDELELLPIGEITLTGVSKTVQNEVDTSLQTNGFGFDWLLMDIHIHQKVEENGRGSKLEQVITWKGPFGLVELASFATKRSLATFLLNLKQYPYDEGDSNPLDQ